MVAVHKARGNCQAIGGTVGGGGHCGHGGISGGLWEL